MKVVVAPDSYKGSLSQVEVATVMKRAIKEVNPTAKVVMRPMADGGEGTLDALIDVSSLGERVPVTVTGPLGEQISTSIGILNHDTAVIEVASIAGLTLVPEESRDPYKTTTYGVGEAIRIALDRGIRKYVIGLGGSATNDGGFGMLLALGAELKTIEGNIPSIFGKELMNIHSINLATLDPRMKQSVIHIASDVDNPLTGEKGATVVFGAQKGATRKQIHILDEALVQYGLMLEREIRFPLTAKAGAGAAGGLGFALMAIGGSLVSGAKFIAEAIELEKEIATADLVITGEGRSDSQTLYGKAPGYVAELARRHSIPVVLVSGSIADEQNELKDHFTEIHSIMNSSTTLRRAMKEADVLLLTKLKEILRRNK